MSLASKKGIAKAILKLNKAKGRNFNLKEYLFPEQYAFISDPSPNKLAVCSRRAGKTIACAADLVFTATNNPETVSVYITLSRNNAKRIIWREIKKINRDYNLGGKENSSELSVTFPNQSIIYLSGAKDTNEIEKFRGLALKLVYIDEAQSFREYIKELINDVLAPDLLDHAGTLVLIGTPSAIPTGYFHDCAQEGSNWSKHRWTFFNNPFLLAKSKMTHKQMLDRELARRGVLLTDPSIQREYFGKWVTDSDSLLIKYNEKLNDYVDLPALKPPARWNYIMGIDLGFDDADAIAIIGWSEAEPGTYLIEEKVVPQQGLTELVEQIQAYQKKYDIAKMVIDQGGLGKKLAEEMRRRHQIPVEPADKARKIENIAFLNDTLRTSRFKAKKTSKFAQDAYLVEIDQDKSTADKIKVSDKYHSDIIDAVLYAFRESPAFTFQKEPEKPKYGSKAWAKQQEVDMFDNALEHFQEQSDNAEWWKKLSNT